jgi:DNA-binding LytR/AlgR family response regulator
MKMQKRERLIIKECGRTHSLLLEIITHISYSDYLCNIHMENGKVIHHSKPLKHYEEELAEYGFVRINHHTIINFNRVNHLRLEKGRLLILDEILKFEISRRKMYRVKKIIG